MKKLKEFTKLKILLFLKNYKFFIKIFKKIDYKKI